MNNVEFPDRFHERDREGNDKLKTVASTPRGWIGPLFGLVVFTILVAALGYGAWRHFSQGQQVIASSEKIRDFVPKVRVAAVRASDGTILVTLPATTSAFAEANINSRASGYIEKRYVDIGDRVKEAQPLARITAPEVEHQIAQGEATLAQNRSTVLQVQANLELARVTWARDKPLVEAGWTSSQQGSIDVQNFKSLEAALNVAKATVTAQESQLRVLNQQKIYQSVVAPFDGVITQRNVDVGSLVQADPVNATFMFTIVQSDVIRTQVFVPQDQAFGLSPGVDAVVRVPEIPDRTFPGKVSRIADALQPDTRTLLTEIDVPNGDGALSPGIYCTVELHIPRKTPSFLVPAEAIIFNREGLQVAVVEDGVARIRKVVVARDLGTAVELRDGVKPGDQVILNPVVQLADGDKVRVAD